MSPHALSRRQVLQSLAALAGAALFAAAHRSSAASPELKIDVWKSPTCGCCIDWIKHLQANGFVVNATNVPDSRHVRARFGMPAKFASCHTALIGGYVIEGHVPARDIKRLLREKPQALGIAVPGMPVGSPGMDGPSYSGMRDPYDVLLVFADGKARVFASYE
jgi:hypothetical protein